jgi:hypothetical protein
MSDSYVRCRRCGWVYYQAGQECSLAKCYRFHCSGSSFAEDFEVLAKTDPRVPICSTILGIRWPLPTKVASGAAIGWPPKDA